MVKPKIEWADKVWNPTTGCEKVSTGCLSCNAERLSHRLRNMPNTAKKYCNGFRPTVHPNKMAIPNSWKKPQTIFVCSMGDLFHESIPFEFIAQVLKVIRSCQHHDFMLLTKRVTRMREFFTDYMPVKYGIKSDTIYNMWLGVSVENQITANERIPELLRIPTRKRFICAEPLLDTISLQGFDIKVSLESGKRLNDLIHLLIIGMETGAGARITPLYKLIDLAMDGDFLKIPVMVKNIGKQNDGTRLELIKNTGI